MTTSLGKLLSLPENEKVILFDSIIEFLESYVKDNHPGDDKPDGHANGLGRERLDLKLKSSSSKYDHVSSLNPEDEECFNRLRTWRNTVARDLEWSAYMVLDNKTLMSIAHYKPTTEEDMLRIKGMGPEKLGRYFETIKEIIEESKTKVPQRRLAPASSRATGSVPSKAKPPKPVEEKKETTTKRFLGPNTLEYVSDDE